MTAHAERADIIKVNDTEIAARAVGWHEECADDGIGAARFVDDGGAIGVEVAAEAGNAFGERPGAKIGTAGEDEAGGFAAGMGVEHVDRFHDERK